MASTNISLPAVFIAAYKAVGSTRVRVNVKIKDIGNQDGASIISFACDSVVTGDAYLALAPGTACTVALSSP